MERIARGDIWIVQLVAHPKPRPGLVVSINPVNDLCPDVLIVPITTIAGPLRVALPEDARATGLRVASFATCESVGPIHKSRLTKRIGAVPAAAWPAIEAGLARVLGLEIEERAG